MCPANGVCALESWGTVPTGIKLFSKHLQILQTSSHLLRVVYAGSLSNRIWRYVRVSKWWEVVLELASCYITPRTGVPSVSPPRAHCVSWLCCYRRWHRWYAPMVVLLCVYPRAHRSKSRQLTTESPCWSTWWCLSNMRVAVVRCIQCAHENVYSVVYCRGI